ncbi:MAG: hypothetical protein JRC86_02980 [Deltaproteobacteria bacterium]|nr:hypothetical protein [Deltaproteobacteria bacterium]
MATALAIVEATWEEIDGSKFLIKPLDGKDMLRVSDVVTFDKKGRTLINAEACIVLMRHGLMGWKEFADAEGNAVVFSANQEDNLKRIPFTLVRDLALSIFTKSSLGAEDEKN